LLATIFVCGCLQKEGCEENRGLFTPRFDYVPDPDPVFLGYDLVRPDSSFGWIRNHGGLLQSGLRVAVNLGCDSVVWVGVSKAWLGVEDSVRVAAPSEIVQGVPAGPPLAWITWNYGGREYLTPAELGFAGWISEDDSSAVGWIGNGGGDSADSIRVRVETRHGIQVLTTLDGPSMAAHTIARFRAAKRDSAGVRVYPRVLDLHWVSHRCTVIR
jgi:hypothetical protein